MLQCRYHLRTESTVRPSAYMPAARYILAMFRPTAVCAAVLLSLCTTLPCFIAVAQTPADTPVAVTLSGTVVDASAKPVSGAQVFAESGNAARSSRVVADVSGMFRFPALEPGSYTIHAVKGGTESKRLTMVLTKADRHDLRVVLDFPGATPPAGKASAAQAGDNMDFVDKPTFTVAGVTDWTAVGGHGSDATLRTSEDLNREALALRAGRPPAARAGSDKADGEYDQAVALNSAGDFAAAQRHIKQALALKDAGDFHRLAGELEEKLGNPLAAVQEDQRATQLDASEENYFAWGSELLLHRAIWQAAEVFANGAKAYPASVRLHTAWGAALFAGARYEDAAQKICEASDLDPSAREPYLFAGQISLASPSLAGCVPQKLERFLALRPRDAEANYFFAMYLLKHRPTAGPDQIQTLLLKAVAMDPKYSDAYLQLGILSATRKNYTGAIAFYKQALEADPQKGEAHYRLGIAYDRTGDPAKARAEYQLHDQIDAANAAMVEQQRREVKQFSIVTDGSAAPGAR